MDKVSTIVIGAGVVGLAIAARLAATGREVLVLDREPAIGQGISSRNSEVIHAGIYYPEDTLKAKLCVEGKARLYEYCIARGLPHQRLGKLIVATSDQDVVQLGLIRQRAEANGVMDLSELDQAGIQKLEPEVFGVAALLSPSTGIVSAHDLMVSLAGDVSNHGGQVVAQANVVKLELRQSEFRVICDVEGSDYVIGAREVVNAAGLDAQRLSGACEFLPDGYKAPKLHLCRGVYFSYGGARPFERLIYPVPEANTAGLGVHATLDLGRQVKFGPDTEYIETENYAVPEAVPEHYVSAIKRYFPGLESERLASGYAGIRPKLAGPGEAARDFVIEGPAAHGVAGFVQLFGIESPGLTASLAIGQYVHDQLVTIGA